MFKKLFCNHNYIFVRNIYGDEIIHSGFKRSILECSECEKTKLSEYLNKLS